MSFYNHMRNLKTDREFDLGTHISLKNSYIYFQVSKAASSTVKKHLQELEVTGTGRKVLDVNNRNLSPHVWSSQLSESYFEQLIMAENVRKIAFVRNPYSRILSCYLHRILAEPNSPSNRALAKANGGRSGASVSFSEFVKVICDQESRDQEGHWKVQSDEILFELVPHWSFIGRFENLMEDVGRMLALLGGGRPVDSNSSPMATSANKKVLQYYTSDIQKDLLERYRADFHNFDYSESLDLC